MNRLFTSIKIQNSYNKYEYQLIMVAQSIFKRISRIYSPWMETKQLVGMRIKEIRKRHDMTQAKLAERIDRSVDAVSNLERGISLPNFDTLERLSIALDVPIREFFSFQKDDDSERSKLLTNLLAIASTLSKEDLEIIVDQTKALADKRRQTGQEDV